MLYGNSSKKAVLAMEFARTGGYGDYDDGGQSHSCPCCGAPEPEMFYVNDEENCVGCSECVYVSDRPW